MENFTDISRFMNYDFFFFFFFSLTLTQCFASIIYKSSSEWRRVDGSRNRNFFNDGKILKGNAAWKLLKCRSYFKWTASIKSRRKKVLSLSEIILLRWRPSARKMCRRKWCDTKAIFQPRVLCTLRNVTSNWHPKNAPRDSKRVYQQVSGEGWKLKNFLP